jgi:hypothetical protein
LKTNEDAIHLYKVLKNGVVENDILRIEDGSRFPVATNNSRCSNIVLVRQTVLNLLDIFIFIVENNLVEGKLEHCGVLITGPPGDGKVLFLLFKVPQFFEQLFKVLRLAVLLVALFERRQNSGVRKLGVS